ncbi:MFS transporter [Poseidonocella sedimentorum]|uniref:Sugar phosphate permease n=1 Tax=Poseidonocella sedimentorum TaxID=871652 RepID=A0A1I6D731_9RHOB|nr:MFS transporter [Poseidonocella sedimentorum]SFR01137.1 Sugar phosphate permease [Poseidonocella sedimentorum]
MIGFLRDNLRWLLAGILLTFCSCFGQTFFVSVFAGEIMASFELSHGDWGALYTVSTMAAAVVMLCIGGLTDRFRIRTLGPAVLAMLAITCLGMAFAREVVWLGVVIFGLRLFGQGLSTHLATVSMARWFSARRGMALSVARFGYLIGEAALPLLIVAAMAIWPWQTLWFVPAAVALLAIPVLRRALLEERTPQSLAKSSESVGMLGRHWTRRETLGHYLFWAMILAQLGPPAFNTAFFFQQVHYAEVKGFTHVQIVALFPFFTGAGVVAMLGAGWAVDRFGAARTIVWSLLPAALGFACFAFGPTLGWTLLGMILLASTSGAASTLPGAFWAEFYGTRHIGAIKSMASALMVFGSAIGPGLTGGLIDAGVGIEAQYAGIAVYFLLATALMGWGLRRALPDLAVAPEVDVVRP